MSQSQPRSLQDIIDRRQKEEFIGRQEQQDFFRQNLEYGLDDERKRFIINISGQGGVGKTWLIRRRFQKIAEESGALTAYLDETVTSVSDVMACISDQLKAQGYSLKSFIDRYRTYRQRMHDIEIDRDAPQEISETIGRVLTKGGLQLIRAVPYGGTITSFVDEDNIADLGGKLSSYLTSKRWNKDDIELVLEPEKVLTPLFLTDLQKVAAKRNLVLFFDTYEYTDSFLDDWLRQLLEKRFGPVPPNILIVIAGRNPLNQNNWSPYIGLLTNLSLEPFSREEAIQYLARKGITNNEIIEVILHLSGRFPVFVAMLASESPDDPTKVGDPTGEAVERFLRWVETPVQRQLALDAALPQYFNRDIVAVLVGTDDADDLFNWLQKMPFAEKKSELGWIYHEVVRTQMLRYRRAESPQSWSELHGKLAEYYENLRDVTGQSFTLNILYHRLCQAPEANLEIALRDFVSYLKELFFDFLKFYYVPTVYYAGVDVESNQLIKWALLLNEGLDGYSERRYKPTIQMFNSLLRKVNFGESERATVLDWRGHVYSVAGDTSKALEDLNKAIELAPNEAEYWVDRGLTYQLMNSYDNAIADLDRAVKLAPDYIWALRIRASTYSRLGQFQVALSDYSHIIELVPNYAWAIAMRGEIYRQMGCYKEALSDFEQAIKLEPECDWCFYWRGLTFESLGQMDRAREDFKLAIQYAQKSYEKEPQNWRNTFNLAVYSLAYGESDKADHLYREAISGGASQYIVHEAIHDLEDALSVFPDHSQAQAMRDLLQQHLREAKA